MKYKIKLKYVDKCIEDILRTKNPENVFQQLSEERSPIELHNIKKSVVYSFAQKWQKLITNSLKKGEKVILPIQFSNDTTQEIVNIATQSYRNKINLSLIHI